MAQKKVMDDDLTAEQLAEFSADVEAIKSGKVVGVPLDEAFAQINARIKAKYNAKRV